ncbi:MULTISPECIES: hypothetical protein [Paenibacillus]|uniref:Nucleotidyltransferase n=1 Tax=Paenibacillus borealis TaxID=160799 RepID=A0ABX3GUL5_PAEBO|nr:hypothetical protein [Paenibacillus borealis]OMD37682.1 nucleotidyltransferase [Paenibacillus borealis]
MSVAEKETIKTVSKAFGHFSKTIVDLDPTVTSSARSSRSWLVGKLESFPGSVDGFPNIYEAENDVQMGSFSRRTKTRPLDDIDFLLVFSADGAWYTPTTSHTDIIITVPSTASNLYKLCDNGELNSRKFINKIVSALSNVPQYDQADIGRNQEVATLKLKSYSWNFDIAPAFITAPDAYGKTVYLIPDGNGKWKETDPRIDASRTTSINAKHNGKVLKLIRLIKYWNKNRSMPTISSYLLENLALNYFDSKYFLGATEESLKGFFADLQNSIYLDCQDPKGIQGNLNTLDFTTQMKISAAAKKAEEYAASAIQAAEDGDQEEALDHWIEVFGSEFPAYGQEVE